MNTYKKLILSGMLALPLSFITLPINAQIEEKDLGVRYCTWVHPHWQGEVFIPGHQTCSNKQYRQGDWIWSPGHWHNRPRYNDRIWVPGRWVQH